MDADLGARPDDGYADDRNAHDGNANDGYGAFQAFQEGSRLLAESNSHAAVVALERARDLEPDAPSVRETLARAYFRAGNLLAATAEFERSVELDPVNDYAHFGLGLCLLRRGDQVGARRNLKLAVAMRPESADYRHALDRALRMT